MLENKKIIEKDKVQAQGFTKIPNKLMVIGGEITDAEFRLYCTLRYHAFQKDYCYPGRLRLAREIGASVAKVDRIKKKLEQKKLFKKIRRGQGKTNVYNLSELFFSEANNSNVIIQDDASMTQKEDEINKTKTINNYLVNQTSREISSNNGEPPQRKSPPRSKTPNEVIIISLLNRAKKEFDGFSEEKFKEYELSTSTNIAIKGISYYLKRYKEICRVEHPLYKYRQLHDCLFGFLSGMWEIEQRNLPMEQTIADVIERWFATTNEDPNNLRLSHFAGTASFTIFLNCLDAL